MIDATDHASLITSIDEIGKIGHGGTLVVVTGRPTNNLGRAIDNARRSFGTIIPVVCAPDGAEVPPGSVTFTDPAGFAAQWHEQLSRGATR